MTLPAPPEAPALGSAAAPGSRPSRPRPVAAVPSSEPPEASSVAASPADVRAERAADGTSAWRSSIAAVGFALVVLLGAFAETVAATVETWWSASSYNHGLIVVPVVLFLLWDRRHDLARLTPRASAWGLPLIAAASAAWTVGETVHALVVQQFALVGMIWGVVLTVVGPRAAWGMAFPLAFLLFGVPFGDFLVVHLQDLTADMTVTLLRASSVPVFSDGVILATSFGNFEVAEACAGLRFLTACLAFGTLFAWMFFRTWPRRLLFIGLSVVVPIIANGFRAYGIIMLARAAGIEAAAGVDHLVYGWIFFSLVMALLGLAGWFMRQDPPPRGADGGDGTVEGDGDEGRPAQRRFSAARLLGGTAVALVVALALPTWMTSENARTAQAAGGLIHKPLALVSPDGWAPAAAGGWAPVFPGAREVVRESFESKGAVVDRVVAWYPLQEQGREVVHRGNDLTGEGWRRLSTTSEAITVDGQPVEVKILRLGRGDARRIVWSWYWIDGTYTGDDRVAKLLEARSVLFGGSGAGALIAVSAQYTDPLRAATAEGGIRAFVGAHQTLSTQLAAAARNAQALARR